MPPGLGGDDWAVAKFDIDNMYSNNDHRKILSPKQRYKGFLFILNGEIKKDSVIELNWLVVWRGVDKQPPTAPGKPRFMAGRKGLTLTWPAAADNVKVSHYELLNEQAGDWRKVTIATANWLRAAPGQLVPGRYAVRAVDVAGNTSKPSPAVDLK